MKTSFSQKIRNAGMALLAVSAVAYATVTFDASNGTGFVGKGDVQAAFGWNNKEAQNNIGGLVFSFNATDHYAAVCEWVTGLGTRGQKTHDISLMRRTSIASSVAFEARSQRQISGINLNGFSSTVTTGTPPVVGDPCVNNDNGTANNGTYISVVLVSSTGGLFVTSGGNTVQLL
jgi:hypothetical protein